MHPLATKITTLQRRLATRQRAAAFCRTLAAVLAAALALGLADYAVRFTDRGLRWMATTTLVVVTVWAVYRWWYLPSRRSAGPGRHHSPISVARRVEARFPQLSDALASAVEFLQQSEDDATAGSAQLRRVVVAEAATAVEELPLDEVIDRRPLRRAAGWVAAAVGVLAVFTLLDARAVVTAAARLAAPFGGVEWPRNNYLKFRDPPTRLAAGQTFEAELVDTSGRPPDEVWIEYRFRRDGRRETVTEAMTRVGDVLVARRENVRQSFSFRAEGGDDRTMRWIDVAVVEAPRIESLNVTVHPPAYTGLPAAAAERHLAVLAGSRIEISGTANEPLGAARILLDGGQSVAATIRPGMSGEVGRGFYVAPDQWIATTSGAYRLELEDVDGVAGVVGSWQLRVEPDPPPSVAWKRPSEDLYVLTSAVVPLGVLVRDNLAVRDVDLIYEPSDAEAGRFRIADFPPRRANSLRIPSDNQRSRMDGDARTVEHEWPLAPLGLAPGARLTLHVEASDDRPGTGRTVVPRRITIITIEELDKRLADRQVQIVRQLERTLAVQRATREEVRRVAIQHRDAGALTDGDRNTLQSAELNQRRVDRLLADPNEGLPASVASLLEELAINRVDSPDVERAMGKLSAALTDLETGPLGLAKRELTAARKTAEATSVDANELSRSLSAAGAAQDDVLAVIERLIADLSDWADYRRFFRQLVELRDDQIAHEHTTRAEIELGTSSLELNELTRDQRARLSQAAAGEGAIARRFEKIVQGMERLAGDLDLEDAAASDRLKDAVALARQLAIAANMRDATRDLAENRVGRTLTRELQIADDLEQVLNVLRDSSPNRDDLLDELRRAERELAAIRQQLAELRQQARDADSEPARPRSQLEQQQQELRRELDRLARQLERMEARDAGESTQAAADRLDDPPDENQMERAEQDLEQAARQLAQRRARAELDLALEFMNRFRAELKTMIERQQQVIGDTMEIDAVRERVERLSPADAGRLELLAAEERQLAALAIEHSEMLAGLGAVRVSLEEAARRLSAAADLLAARESGDAAQQAERHALARLEGMMDAFAQTVAEAQQKPNEGNAGGGNAGGAGPQRRPAFELLEVKMLRMLQVELNQRTERHQQRLAAGDGPLDEGRQAELQQEARDLAAEQSRLAELVRQMLLRNNEEQGEE